MPTELKFSDKELAQSMDLIKIMQGRVTDADVKGDVKALIHCCIAQELTLYRIMLHFRSPVLVSEANKQGETNPVNTVPALNSNGHSMNCPCKYCPPTSE